MVGGGSNWPAAAGVGHAVEMVHTAWRRDMAVVGNHGRKRLFSRRIVGSGTYTYGELTEAPHSPIQSVSIIRL
jgi:hypothetical protein